MTEPVDFLIVEDELLIAETIAEILSSAGFKKHRISTSVEEAVKEIELCKPHMVLTDINLEQEKNGIDLGEILLKKYHIPFIYITSHASQDIINRAKFTHPNAYIIKPFKKEDLLVAIELALFNYNSKSDRDVNHNNQALVVKEGRAVVRIDCMDIKYMETDGNYTTINLVDKRRVVRIPITELLQQLPPYEFVRIHKSYLINKKYITEIKSNSLFIQELELPIGRSYQQSLQLLKQSL